MERGKELRNLQNIASLLEYLKSQEGSEPYIRKLIEISVYCNEIERETVDFNIENVPRPVRVRMAMRIYEYLGNWLTSKRKIK